MSKFIFAILFISLIFITTSRQIINPQSFNNENLDENLDENCRITNCEQCHKGFAGQACDKCINGWGVYKKAVGDDLCVLCSSAVPHCTSCADTKIWWNCFSCEPGFKLVNVLTGDDYCTKAGEEEFLSKNKEELQYYEDSNISEN